VVGAFADGHAALIGRGMTQTHCLNQMGKRRYLAMEPLLNPAKQEAAA
jgi:hypothetical protein